MKRHILRWVKNIDELAIDSKAEADYKIKELDKAIGHAMHNTVIEDGILGSIKFVSIPLTIAGTALSFAGIGIMISTEGIMDPNVYDAIHKTASNLTYAGLGVTGASLLPPIIASIAGPFINKHFDKVARLAERKQRLIKEIAKARGYEEIPDNEIVEDEIQ